MTDLKLLALDSEDLDVISATTQDAIVRVGDMGYAKADKRFALLMNRYAWEDGGNAKTSAKTGVRKRAALHFDRVIGVKVAGIDTNAVDGALELLTIRFTESLAPSGWIDLAFAGGGTVRLEVEVLEARLQDLGSAWAAKAKPEHAA
ncbi:MAG: hypothetical protein JWQ89_2822 [Devosia sp.]|uniref:DUF2948 family protein n=1 Tax=Devosia sp. TaxID=1871048 RepID=UPI00262BB98F|nr:DUF2948 family protein [Devosia sp.]MDB5541095.1 hypothetical protein [Devosia sp.]